MALQPLSQGSHEIVRRMCTISAFGGRYISFAALFLGGKFSLDFGLEGAQGTKGGHGEGVAQGKFQ